MEKLKSWSFGKIRDLVLSIQDEMKCDSEYQVRFKRQGLGRKNQYFEHDYTTKCNLQIQCESYQITNGIFHRTRTKNFTIHMETQKTANSQNSLEKEEWSWTSGYTTRLKSSRQYGTDTKAEIQTNGTR